MADALTRWPGFSSSPWIRRYPQPWFSVASRPVSVAISALTGGRPVRCGQVHVRVTRRRCHRRTVPGVTSRCIRSRGGRSRFSAAGPVEPGPRMGAAQHGDLVPQHEQPGLLGCR
jgi:hypothetical protein